MVITRTVEMHAQLVGYDFKKKGLPTDKNIAVENSKVSNDYFWKTNKYTDQDVFGRTLDLTALINKPDGYLKGSLSDTEDVDYYEFNITEYRALSFAKDTYNKDITIILDHIPEGCDYEMVLYDEEGNQVGIGKENGNGGLSITIPNWNSDNRGYTVKVQAKNGSTVNPDAEYHLSFQTTQADKSHGAYQEMEEVQKYEGTVRKQMQEGLTDTEETRAIKEIRQKYKAYYTELMEATRKNAYIELGVSPRGTIACVRLAKAWAFLQGRNYVIPDDVTDIFADVAKHRIVLNTKARIGHVTVDATLQEILSDVDKPTTYKRLRG